MYDEKFLPRHPDFKPSAHEWPNTERRNRPMHDDPNHIVSQLQGYIDEKLTEFRKENRQHIDTRIDEIVLLIKDGFPGGDPRGHREVHEGYIADAKSKKEMRDAVIKQLLTGSAWATVIFVAGAIWMAIKAEAKK